MLTRFFGNLLMLSAMVQCSGMAFGVTETFEGDVTTIVDTDAYEFVHTTITGEAAKSLFNVVAALSRIQTVNDHLRRVRGAEMTCFEHFTTDPVEELISYSCEFVVAQGGHFRAP